MCRIVERVYVLNDGSRQTFEEPIYCSRAHRPNYCNNVTKRTTEYYDTPSLRDDPAPRAAAQMVPATPKGSANLRVVEPAARHSSNKDSAPKKIIINFGGTKKEKSKKYHDSGKRSSLGARSVASSNEVNLDTPGSASPIRTGFPETTPPAYPIGGYATVTARPSSHHRHSSSSSFTTSQTPSLYTTSDAEHPPPVERSNNRRNSTVIHNPDFRREASPTRTPRPSAPAGPKYRVVTPNTSNPNVADGGLYPLDYTDPRIPSNPSSANSSRVASSNMTNREVEDALHRLHLEDRRKKEWLGVQRK